MITISICLSDIPEEKITKAKNGKNYINLVMFENRETDKFGNTHNIQISKTQEEREARVPTVYVGNGKVQAQKNQSKAQSDNSGVPGHPPKEDLPF